MIKQHKPMCKSNMNCLVIHPDGICPWKNECDCDYIKIEDGKEIYYKNNVIVDAKGVCKK